MLLLMVLLMRSLIAEHMLYILTIPDMMYLNACLVDVTYHMDGYDRNAVVGDVSQQMALCQLPKGKSSAP